MRSKLLQSIVVGLGLLGLTFLAASPANADTIYSSLPTYQFEGTGLGEYYPDSTGLLALAADFMPDGAFDATQIDVGVSWQSGTSGIDVTLSADSAGAPGSVLAAWSFSDLPLFGASIPMETEFFSSGIALESGQEYWITVSPVAADTRLVWNIPVADSVDASPLGLFMPQAAACNLGGGWFPCGTIAGAFDVLGTPIPTPEPSGALLLETGLFALAGLAKLKRRAPARIPRCGAPK